MFISVAVRPILSFSVPTSPRKNGSLMTGAGGRDPADPRPSMCGQAAVQQQTPTVPGCGIAHWLAPHLAA
jgi:hypothetical protein